MLHQIARKAPAPQDAVSFLLQCHERIRNHLAIAQRLCDADGAKVPPEQLATAAETVRKYFSSAYLQHTREEDEVVFRVLLGFSAAIDTETRIAVTEHEDLEGPIAAIIALCSRIASYPADCANETKELRRELAALTPLLLNHLKREESVIFPAFLTHIAPEIREQVFLEIRRRRGSAGLG